MGHPIEGGLLEARGMMPAPSPQEQIEFLQKIQRLLTEGLFVASYKFALLRALADLAVIKGDDSGNPLELSVAEIASVFVEVYWRQTRPFCTTADSTPATILRQNTGKQAAIIQHVAAAQTEYAGSFWRLRQDQKRWDALVREIANVVAVMPLWKLQRVGDEVMDFLYPNVGAGRTISLRPGVAYCLRRFYGILRNLIEGTWVNYVRAVNLPLLGHVADIGSFLFGKERAALESYRPLLMEIQKGSCFYCGQLVRQAADVDHFIPWSRYPLDLGHNFVLAHKTCNGEKCDYLAAERHLAAWLERNEAHSKAMEQSFADAKLPANAVASVSIARWAYSQTAEVNGLVWVEKSFLAHLEGNWIRLLADAA
jgi:5-methylcytosine-specific restriction endonuclease McrA